MILLQLLQLRVYAGRSDILQDSGNTYLVGFSLPESGVSGQGFRDASYTPFYLVYTISSIVLYALCVTTAFFIVSKTHSKMGMKEFTHNNSEVLIGLTIVMSVFIVLELVTEFVMAGIWSEAVKDPVIAVYVVTSTVLYCIPGVVSVCMIVKTIIIRHIKTKKDGQNTCNINSEVNNNNTIANEQIPEVENQSPRKKKKSITAFPLYSFIWLASYFAYLLLYFFFLPLYSLLPTQLGS
jgi:small-conductance mechanosensitive channel